MKKIISGLTLLLLMSHSGLLQAQTAKASLSKDEILIGDQVALRLTLQLQDSSQQVVFPKMADTISKIEILNKGEVVCRKVNDTWTYEQVYTLTCFDSGRYEIPSFDIQFSDLAGSVQVLKTSILPFKVNTVAVDTTQAIKPIVDILPEDTPSLFSRLKRKVSSFYIPVVITIGGLLLLGMLYFYLLKRKRRKRALPELPHIKAYRLLKELKENETWITSSYKEFSTVLTNVVKDYLDNQFDLDTQEMTTSQLLRLLKQHAELRSIHKETKFILLTTDAAKFAKSAPSDEDIYKAIKYANRIIDKTKPKEEVSSDK